MGGQACVYLSTWLASPNASLEASTPQVFAALSGSGARAGPASAPAASRAPALAPSHAAAPTPPIHGYGMIQTYGMGYGGMMIVDYAPAVLFQSGEMLTDIEGLANPGGAAADKREHPAHWTQWRAAGGGYEYATRSGKWQAIPAGQVWKTPPVANLAGRFVHTGGGGNLALGGTSAVFAQTSYEFLPGGRLVREGLASASSEASGGGSTTRTVANSRSGQRAGRYTVEGVTMRISYDDGARESLVFMAYPRDHDIIWLNGVSYVRGK